MTQVGSPVEAQEYQSQCMGDGCNIFTLERQVRIQSQRFTALLQLHHKYLRNICKTGAAAAAVQDCVGVSAQ